MDIPTPEPPTGGGPSSRSDDEPTPVRDRLQVIAQIVTLVVALSAIGLSVWQGIEMRQHNRLSVIPKLQLYEQRGSENGQARYRLAMRNSGLGPAVLHRIQVVQEGRVLFDTERPSIADTTFVHDRLLSALETAFPDSIYRGSSHGVRNYPVGWMLQTKDYPLLNVTIPALADSMDASRLSDRLNRVFRSTVTYHYCYCSVYREDCAVASFGPEEGDPPVCRAFVEVP